MGLDTKAVAALSNPSFEVFQAADILQGFRRAVKFQDFRLANVLLFSSRTRSISPSLTLPFALGSQGAGQDAFNALPRQPLAGSDLRSEGTTASGPMRIMDLRLLRLCLAKVFR